MENHEACTKKKDVYKISRIGKILKSGAANTTTPEIEDKSIRNLEINANFIYL